MILITRANIEKWTSFIKFLKKNGEIKKIKISDEEASLLEFEGFPLIKTNKKIFLHD